MVIMTTMQGNIEVYDNLLEKETFADLKKYVDTLPFDQPTPVFHIPSGQDVIDQTVRDSLSVTVNDSSVLEMVRRAVIQQFTTRQSNQETDLVVKLARNYVTFIHYNNGGQFDWHTDHERVRINGGQRWLECHLLLCITAPQSGGELEVQINSNTTKFPMDTNRCIVFDKALMHRGCVVTGGTKQIMTVDVLVSTEAVQSYGVLGLEVVQYLTADQSFMTPYNGVDDILVDLTGEGMLFELIKLETDEGSATIICDCAGVYYVHRTVDDADTDIPSDNYRPELAERTFNI